MLETLRDRRRDNPAFGTAESFYTGYAGTIDERRKKNFKGCKELFDQLNDLIGTTQDK